MDREVADKYMALQKILRRMGRTAIAYSGGVDSSFLAYAAAEALDFDSLLILHARSCLLARSMENGARNFIDTDLQGLARYVVVDVAPLADPDFVANRPDRCYICKSMIYRRLIEAMQDEGYATLADGTNCSDLTQDRPGLRAIRELGVRTPLVEAGFSKDDIRTAAAALGLSTADLPSNSCLATRIARGEKIVPERLEEIERHEAFLHGLNYQGCRVRPGPDIPVIAVQTADLPRIATAPEREKILAYFRSNGYRSVFLDLTGR